jgi:S1-C subfamily serine protease
MPAPKRKHYCGILAHPMKKLLAFIFWPALAGLVFAFTLLQAPRLVDAMPGLAPYFPRAQVAPGPAPGLLSFNTAVRKSVPSVVSINYTETMDRLITVLTPRGLAQDKITDESKSLGSGVIIRPDGYIITSYHVVSNQPNISDADITVTLDNGRTMEARVVSVDQENDLALLKVDAENLPALVPTDTSHLLVGDIVLAIGNPRNVGQSVTMGIVSALWRKDDTYVIQTDAAINPGNSGGALVDINGNLIGINSTIVSESGGSEGIGFSIPATEALELLGRYLASGPRGYLGVTSSPVEVRQARARFGVDIQGVEVNEVAQGGPADRAGIKVGDIITAADDTKLTIPDPFDPSDETQARAIFSPISDLPAGSSVVIEVFREGEFLKIPVVLGAGDPRIYRVYELPDRD